MAAAAGGELAVRKALQSVAQSTGWTYSLLWRLCPRQGALVWAEGHYNGAVRTRKTTVHHHLGGAAGEEEETTAAAGLAALRRSQQLKELYDSLAAAEDGGGGAGGGGAQQQHHHQHARRPTAALAPEDLTETEWFYLMCASYCFPPHAAVGVGLPGEAFVRRVHVWLCGANTVDSKVFSRAILARSAGIQTVACIPVDDGVLEIGTTEKVEEDISLIQYARSIFMAEHGAAIMPTLSGHSTSTPTTLINHQPFQTRTENCISDINVQKNSLNSGGDEHNNEMEDDDDHRNDLLEINTGNDSSRHSPQDTNVGNGHGTMLNAGNSELMLTGTSERVRDGCSNQEDEEIPVLMVCQNNGNLAAQCEFGPWHDFLDEDLSSNKYLQSSAAEDQAVLAENAHYVETVLTILRFNACRQRQAASNTKTYLALSKNSSFSRWTSWNHKGRNDLQSMSIPEGTAQRTLKSTLLGAPSSSQQNYKGDAAVQSPEPRDDGEGTSRSRRAQMPVQLAELSGSHVLKERRRRETLNERFLMLRSLVPFVTKMDRASILGDTIEYVKQLRRRIKELESRARLVDSCNSAKTPPAASTEKKGRHHHTSGGYIARAGTTTAAEASGSCWNTSSSSVGEPPARAAAGDTEVQVSIIESDALLELRCPHREGLLLRVMQALHQELRLEITSVQASSAGDVLLAELRAKVKEVHGRRSSISEVKRAIHLIVSSD